MTTGFPRPAFEVADIVRAHEAELRRTHIVTAAQAKVLRHLGQCRTASLGGHRDVCGDCGYERLSYNSCRDRHCPKCQGIERAKWIERRLEHVLPIPYFHVVFTLPATLHDLVLANKERLYNLLFAAASQTLLHLASEKRRLGAQIGFTAVLHTWGQKLSFHPHVHCVVTGGGLSNDGTTWVNAREKYLLPVKALSRLFRGKFLAGLRDAWRANELNLTGKSSALADGSVWGAFKDQLYRAAWVVYCKPPFGGPEQIYSYLGRYTHKVAISNHRIVAFADGKVTFAYKDYTDGSTKKLLTVSAVEFLARFLLHVLPKGFVRLRHYGLHASSNVGTKLLLARALLDQQPKLMPTTDAPAARPEPSASSAPSELPRPEAVPRTDVDVGPCPRCKTGRLVRHALLGSIEMERSRSPPMAS